MPKLKCLLTIPDRGQDVNTIRLEASKANQASISCRCVHGMVTNEGGASRQCDMCLALTESERPSSGYYVEFTGPPGFRIMSRKFEILQIPEDRMSGHYPTGLCPHLPVTCYKLT